MSAKLAAQADNVTMSGGGLYSLATKGAKDVIDNATPQVLSAIDNLPLNTDSTQFTMADMGCADGGTSLAMVGTVLAAVKAKSPQAQLSVVYADQPRNDFNALVSIVHGLTSFETYLDNTPDVYPLFSGTSFYRQALPSGTLNLGFSGAAFQ